VDFLVQTVLPELYKKHLERKKVLLPFAEKILDKNWKEAQFFRDGDPKFIDFQKGYIYLRPEINQVESKLKRGRFLHISGPPSSGKTVLALAVAYRAIAQKQNVLYFTRPSTLTNNFLHFLSLNHTKRKLDNSKTIIIVDDGHIDVTRCSRLFTTIYDSFENLRLLFVSRPISQDSIEDEDKILFLFTQYMPLFEVSADRATATIADFYSKKKFNRPLPPVVRNLFLHECANDLLLLGRYLKVWDGSAQINLIKVREKVASSVQQDLEGMRSCSRDAVRLFLILGIFYRFEIGVEKGFIIEQLKMNPEDLLKSGDIQAENDFLMLAHSSLAKLYSNVIQSLKMPEYSELAGKYHPFPFSLFHLYVSYRPRNFCEFIIGLRRTPEIARSILNSKDLKRNIISSLESEPSLTLLGWALRAMDIVDHKATWSILKDADLTIDASHKISCSEPSDISLFIFNLHIVSLVKGREWVNQIDEKCLAEKLSMLPLRHFTSSLQRIERFSDSYLDKCINALNVSTICDKIVEEENLKTLRLSLHRLIQVLGQRVDVRVTANPDFSGEYASKIAFYFCNKRVLRFIPGRNLGIPYSHSKLQTLKYWEWLRKNMAIHAKIILDDGAVQAVKKRYSLFPVGVIEVIGGFESDTIIGLFDDNKNLIAVGISNYDSNSLKRIKGMRSDYIRSSTDIEPNRVCDNDTIVTEIAYNRLNEQLTKSGKIPRIVKQRA
jgi:predicted ribosome-associated RNA-binding protein Tma20